MDETESPSHNHHCMCRCFSGVCGRLLNWINDTRPYIPPKDPEARIWYERGKCSRFNLLFPFLTLLLALIDTAMDLRVAVSHYRRGDNIWASLTLAFVIFSVVIIEVVSANWFLEDERSYKKEILRKHGLEIKKWHYLCHFFFCGSLLR